MLHSAAGNATGIPQAILDAKAEEVRQRQEIKDALEVILFLSLFPFQRSDSNPRAHHCPEHAGMHEGGLTRLLQWQMRRCSPAPFCEPSLASELRSLKVPGHLCVIAWFFCRGRCCQRGFCSGILHVVFAMQSNANTRDSSYQR